jgi:hypothetical protein
MRDAKSSVKSRSNRVFNHQQRPDVPMSHVFKFTKRPKLDNQHLVMNMSPQGFMDFVKQYNSGVCR